MPTSLYSQGVNYNGGNSSGSSSGSTTTGRGLFGNLPQGMYNAGGSGGSNAYVRDAQPNELVSHNLNGLLDQNGQYMQLARQSGMDMAGERGLLNSSIAAGNSQRAAIQSAMPIAQGDAAAYIGAAGQNQDALNQNELTAMNNATSLGTARIGANASMYGDDLGLMNQREGRAFSGEQQGLDRSFADYLSQLNHSQNVDMSNLGYQHNLGTGLLSIAGNLLQGTQNASTNYGMAAMNNPAIMENPEAFGNYMQFMNDPFNTFVDDIFKQLFGGSR